MKLNNIVDLNKTSELTEVVTSFRLHICSILTHFNAFMRVFLNVSFGPVLWTIQNYSITSESFGK